MLFISLILLIGAFSEYSKSSGFFLSVTKESSVEGNINFTKPLVGINSSYSLLTYKIEDMWYFEDINREVIQLKEIYLNIHTNNEIVLGCSTYYHWTRLIWKHNGTYAIYTAQLIVEHGGMTCERYNISISLLDYRKFENISDKLNAIITFKNGSQALLREIIQNKEWNKLPIGYDIFLFLNESWTIYSSPVYPYFISLKEREINTGYCIGKAVNFTKIHDTSRQHKVIEVKFPSIKIKNAGETHIFSSRSRYYESETGLMVKEYFINETTNETYLFQPEHIKIVEEKITSELSYYRLSLIILVVFLFIGKAKGKK